MSFFEDRSIYAHEITWCRETRIIADSGAITTPSLLPSSLLPSNVCLLLEHHVLLELLRVMALLDLPSGLLCGICAFCEPTEIGAMSSSEAFRTDAEQPLFPSFRSQRHTAVRLSSRRIFDRGQVGPMIPRTGWRTSQAPKRIVSRRIGR